MVKIRLARAGFLVAAVLHTMPALAADSHQSPLHGSLPRGPHAVGFTRLQLADATRPAKASAGGAAGSPASRARRIDVHVWYPAAPGSTVAPMTFADAMTEQLPVRSAVDVASREEGVRRFMGEFGSVSDDAWARLKATRLLARRDVPVANGRYPLIIGLLRPLSTSITNEFLASHGFVVAMVDGEDDAEPEDSGAALEIDYRDMEFAIPELRKRPDVDATPLGALGFSGSGFSQILLAMRHPAVAAVCDLESAIFDDRVLHPLSRGWGYGVTALRVPFLHTYSVPLSNRENRIAEFEAMRYSTRYRYLVDAPGIHHWDFATEGMAASAVLRNRGANGARLQQAFETTNTYVLKFFTAYLKKDSEALAFLNRSPEANGVPAGLATVRALPAVTPAPTVDEVFAIVSTQGVGAGMQRLDEARKIDPQGDLFQEGRLNRLGYRVLRSGSAGNSIPIFRRIVELFPASSNACDSLAEALEAAGERREAVAVTEKALEVLAKQELTPEQRRDMSELLGARLKRLK